MGRAARNIRGRAILYADKTTKSMQEAIAETERRRKIQAAFNKENGIEPQTIQREIPASLGNQPEEELPVCFLEGSRLKIPEDPKKRQKFVEELRCRMFDAAARKEFEKAAELRDAINRIQEQALLKGK